MLQNRALAAANFGLTEKDMAIAGQVHGAEVREVDKAGLFVGFDGLVTTKPNILLSISAADCAAILLADPIAGVIGACHAGWRGHVADIEHRTVETMQKQGATPSNMFAFVGPCISQKNFEVGDEVAKAFNPKWIVRNASSGKAHVDLSGSIVAKLERLGIPSAQIERSPFCTVDETDLLFSHRAQKGITGRMMGMICINPALSGPIQR